MKTKLSNKIQRQVLFGFIALLIVFFVTASVQWQALHGATHQASIFNQITQLQKQVSQILDRGKYYKNNAPRDFESYNRDVALFYNDIIKQIEIVSLGFKSILNEKEPPLSNTLYRSFNAEIKRDIEMGHMLLDDWNTLVSNFHTALGEDKKNPRLEWGADSLIKQLPSFSDHLLEWDDKHRKLQQDKTIFLKNTIVILLSTAILFSIIGIFWIYYKLLKRVKKMAVACKRVSDGEFGYQIPSNQYDEIGQLIDAFNDLSSRTEAILALVDQLAHANSNTELIEAISNQKHLIKCSWFGLMLLADDKSSLELIVTNRENCLSRWSFKDVVFNKGVYAASVESALITHESLITNDVPQASIEDPHARFLRAFAIQSSCNSLALVPLKLNGRTLGALALGRDDKHAWNKDDLQLLENLNELISSRLLVLNPGEESSTKLDVNTVVSA